MSGDLITNNGGTILSLLLNGAPNAQQLGDVIDPHLSVSGNGFDYYRFNYMTRLYFEPGATVSLLAQRDVGALNLSVRIALHGYLVPVAE